MSPPVTLSFREALAFKFPPIAYLISTWLMRQGQLEIAGWRGGGKTFISLGASMAVAVGTAMIGYRAQLPCKVLFVDGEMIPAELQERLGLINSHMAADWRHDEAMLDERFIWLTYARQEHGIPDLATTRGQRFIDDACDDADLVILDNLSSLVYSGEESNEQSWVSIQRWLMSMRSTGQTTGFVHHTGKPDQDGNVKQRGTSRREDNVTSALLIYPKRGQSEWFQVHFAKIRRGEQPKNLMCRVGQLGRMLVREGEYDYLLAGGDCEKVLV